MEILKFFLTIPENAEKGKFQINIDKYGVYSSKLPWCENEKGLNTVINILNQEKFSQIFYKQEDWMVKKGWLDEAKTDFNPNILKKIGQDIYNALFYEPSEGSERSPKDLLSKKLSDLDLNEELHIQLQFSDKKDKRGPLSDYPWELACRDRNFLTEQRVTFSRLIAFPGNVPDFPTVEQINVLLVSSTIGDIDEDINLHLETLNLQEQEAIYESLKDTGISVECKQNISFKELGAYLSQIPQHKTPHVIHFDGHGLHSKRCNKPDCRSINKVQDSHCRKCNSPLDKTPQGYLVFKSDGTQQADYISATEISNLISCNYYGLENKNNLGARLVVISACQSALTLNHESVFNGIAQQLISKQIPAVVATPYNIEVTAAIDFNKGFYRALADKMPLTTAVSRGQNAIGRRGNQWYRHVLYLRWGNNDGGRLFGENTTLLFLKRYVENLVDELEKEQDVLEYIDLLTLFYQSDTTNTTNKTDKKSITEFTIEQIFANHQKFVLIGEPGSGKSTALKHMALTQAKEFLSEKFTVAMPLILELEFWCDNEPFDSFIKRQCKENNLESIINQDFRERKIILYLDGLDVMSGNKVKKIQQIKKWLETQAPEKIIITCRYDDYQDDDMDLGLPTFEIQPLSIDLIRSFVSQKLNDKSDDFLKQILSNEDHRSVKNNLQQLVSNPYLLSALIIIYKNENNNQLPINKGILLSRLIKKSWKIERQKSITELLPYKNVEIYFANLADYMVQQKNMILKREKAISILNKDQNLLRTGKDAKLLAIKDDTVRFKNRLIQDYFLAVKLKDKDLDSIIQKYEISNGKRLKKIWDSPVIALSGLENEPDKLVQKITKKDPFLAAMCLNSGVKVNNDTLEFIVSQLVQNFDITIQNNFEEIIKDEKVGETKKLLAKYYLNRLGTDALPILGKILIDNQKNAFIKRAIIDLLDIYNDTRIIHSLSEIVKYPSIEEKAIQLAHQQTIKLKTVMTASSVTSLALAIFASNKASKVLPTAQDVFHSIWGDKSEYNQLQLRVPAIYTLSRLKNKEANLSLISGLIDTNNDIRKACLTCLKSSEWQPENEKEQLYLTIAEDRWSDCQAFGELAIVPLISVLNDESESIQTSVINTLGQLGLKAQDAVKPILNKLFTPSTKNNEFQKTCINAVALIPTKLAVIGLLKASLTCSEDLQKLALRKFDNIGEKQKLDALNYILEIDFNFESIIKLKNNQTAKIFKSDENTKLKIAAIKKLGEIGSVDGINILLSTINQENEELVITCINTLSNHKESNVISAILEKLKDKKVSIKKVAIKSLGKLQAEIAVDELVKLLPPLQNKNMFRRNISKISTFFETNLVSDILDALQQIGTSKAQKAIDSWYSENK
jgi:HEAT repeat protein/energy-coupling factor transporter ATP-binding protein EcfA2